MTHSMSSTISPQRCSSTSDETAGLGGERRHENSTNSALEDEDGDENPSYGSGVYMPVEEGDEATEVRTLPSPSPPSRQEMLEHNITHWPFGRWCKHCIAGKAKASKHSSSGGLSSNEIPVVSMDYAFKKKALLKSKKTSKHNMKGITMMRPKQSCWSFEKRNRGFAQRYLFPEKVWTLMTGALRRR